MVEPCPRCAACPDCLGTGVLPTLKECANETCDRWFRFQEGGARLGQYRSTGVIYCSVKCARAQAMREYRRRRKVMSR